MNRINLFPKQLLLTLLTILLLLTHFSLLWSNTLLHTVIYVNNFIASSDTLAHNSDGDTLNYALKTADCAGVTIDFKAVVTKDVICLPNSGEITVNTITGGTAPYKFSLNGMDYDAINPINSSIGAQTVYVRDANGCVGTKSITVNDASYSITTNATVTNTSCLGNDDGKITITPANGTSPFDFNAIGITPLSFSSNNTTGEFKNLKVGSYNITVTDENGCIATVSKTIGLGSSPTIISATPKNTCIGTSAGSISIEASGTYSTLEYSKDGTLWQVNNTITGLSTGTYTVYVRYKEAPNCSSSLPNIVINEESSPLVDDSGEFGTILTNPSCPNGTDGSILIKPRVDGSSLVSEACPAGFSVKWDYMNYSDCMITGLPSGTYNVTVTNISTGCETVKSYKIKGNEDIIPPKVTCKSITVYLDAAGNATISPEDVKLSASDNCGTPTLSLDKSSFNCSNIGDNPVILTATTTTATNPIFNTASCTAKVTVVDNILSPVAKCKTTPVDVILDNSGNATLLAAQVDDGSSDNCSPVTLSVSPENFSCLDISSNPNTVTLTVTNSSDPTKKATCTAQILVTDNRIPDAKCKPIADFNLDVTNPMPAIISESIVNNNSVFNCTTNSLSLNKNEFYCSGPVTMTLSNNLGTAVSTCSSNVNVIISKPTLDFNSILYICKGESTGSIIIKVKDTDPAILSNFMFGISKDGGLTFQFQTSNEFTDLPAGAYKVIIKTSSTCISEALDVNIIEPEVALSLRVTSFTNINCSIPTKGSIEVEGMGGFGTYYYSIDNGENFQESNLFTNLEVGIYTIIVQDESGCSKSITQKLIDPSVSITTNLNATYCKNSVDITLNGTPSGGTFTIDGNPITSFKPSELNAGKYTLIYTVTNSNGCISSDSKVITISDAPNTAITATESSCTANDDKILSGTTVNLSASGTGTFTWDNMLGSGATKTVNPSVSTTYNVTLTDANGCTATAAKSISVISGSNTAITATESSCTSNDDKI